MGGAGLTGGRPFANGDAAARGEMLGIEGDRAHVLVPRNEIYTHVPIGMSNRTFLPQLVPDRIRIVDPSRIQVVEITGPVGTSRARRHVSHLVFQ